MKLSSKVWYLLIQLADTDNPLQVVKCVLPLYVIVSLLFCFWFCLQPGNEAKWVRGKGKGRGGGVLGYAGKGMQKVCPAFCARKVYIELR